MSVDLDFLLQRKVIEISDGMLALRPYRSQSVEEAARTTVDTGTRRGAAQVEATLVRNALELRRTGSLPDEPAEFPTTNAPVRGGDLQAETEWLLAIAAAYVPVSRVGDGYQPEEIAT